MRRAPAWFAAIGVVAASLAWSSAASAASIWVTLAAGLPGSATPSSSSEFQFNNPSGSLVAINQLDGGLTAQATTGGGSSFFGGVGTPVLLNLADGSAYIASGSPPSSATTAGAAGGTPASAAPVAGGTVPSSASLLGINLALPSGSTSAMTATVTDSNGNALGTGSLSVPVNGWFVLGLSPDAPTTTPPSNPITTPPGNTGSTTPPPDSGPPATSTGGSSPNSSPSTATTPEPATLILAAVGGAVAHAWRRSRSPIAPS